MHEPKIQSCVLLAGPVTHNGRVQRTARSLTQVGQVTLVTSGGSAADQQLFDQSVHVIPTVPRATRGFRKWFLLHRLNDQLADAALAAGADFDLIWANDYSTLWPALQIARVTGARVVYDSHELWLETVNQFFPDAVPAVKRWIFKIIVTGCRMIGNVKEPRLAARADAIVTANESFAEVLQRRFGGTTVGVILNTPECKPLLPSAKIRQSLGVDPDTKIVLYQGLLSPGRGLRELVESARYLSARVRLVIVGEGMLLPSLREMVEQLNLHDRVVLLGAVPQADLHEWTSSSDLGVLILEPINLSKRLALANKIFEYMGAGIPLLTTDLPENRRVVSECDCGWLISDWAPHRLAEEIASILAQPDEMKRRGANGRRCCERRYNWEIESATVVDTIEPLIASRMKTA